VEQPTRSKTLTAAPSDPAHLRINGVSGERAFLPRLSTDALRRAHRLVRRAAESAAKEIKRVIRKRVHVETAAAATKHPARSRGRALRKQFPRNPAAFDHAMRARARSEILSLAPLRYLRLVMR